MVYDADGGIVGEARYVVGHLLGRAECALCDITHGPVRRKQDFDRLVAELAAEGHRVEVHHRNEQRDGQADASAGRLPCVLVSDAFFPFADNIEHASAAGIRFIVQPGGSKKDEEVIAACDQYGIAMAFTGMRHFRH